MEYDDEGNVTPVELLYADGSNPNYVRGLCPVQGMNVSGTTIVSCDDGSGGETCADNFPWEGSEDQSSYPKVTEWVQAPDNFNDPSWVNPYDVSKGHRGFIDGDFVMMMYATAPNWKANTVGNESYNLYLRRSFDGGQTWTTLPASFAHIDGETYSGEGTESCEDYGWGGQTEEETCTTYGAGEFEQARNVSRLTGTRITVLDPRYSPSGGMLKESYKNLLCYDDGLGEWVNCGYTEPLADYPEETRDPSVYFVTYETGDNTVVTEETGTVPLDMYYSRATNFGDDYDVVELVPNGQTEPVERWDWLEQGPELAVEASVFANPLGDRFYTVWNQELPIGVDSLGDTIFTDMDVEFRRIFYNLGDVDAYPTASILLASTEGSYETPVELTFVGTARDHDRNGTGVDNWRWVSNRGWSSSGHLVAAGEIGVADEETLLSTEQSFTVSSTDLALGLHTISFTAQDNEGNWANPKTVEVFIAETDAELLRSGPVHLPLIVKDN